MLITKTVNIVSALLFLSFMAISATMVRKRSMHMQEKLANPFKTSVDSIPTVMVMSGKQHFARHLKMILISVRSHMTAKPAVSFAIAITFPSLLISVVDSRPWLMIPKNLPR